MIYPLKKFVFRLDTDPLTGFIFNLQNINISNTRQKVQ
ncbi:MAG: hypothetical protein PWP14_2119 [Methanolobus sp.]|nr:hypothetical protein [Methanolobus sp.]MDK2835198.1 hypothetical protein [Methanolobus sp.]MDN5310725.1 hypothetical protein [Methanolobus sp.]